MTDNRIQGGMNFYGYEMGILMLNSKFPREIGDVGNALSYEFPVIFRTIDRANVQNVVTNPDNSIIDEVMEAAKELENLGVKAISTSCGFLVIHQKKIAEKLSVPFFSSALLLLPLIENLNNGKILVVTADSRSLGEEYFRSAGMRDTSRVIIKGLQDMKEFSRVILNDASNMDMTKIAQEVRHAVSDGLNNHANVKSVLFECHNLPPYSRDISNEFHLPVFDYFTLIGMIHDSVSKKKFI